MHKRFKRTPSFRYLDILSNSNFFQAFSASSNVPAITCQQEIDFCRVKPRHPVLQMLWGSSLKLMLMHDRDCYGRKVEKESHFSRLVEKMLKLNKNLFSRRGDDPDLELANEDGVWKRIRKGGRRKKKRTTDQFILVRRDQTRMITTGLFQPEMTHQKSDHESSFNHLTQTRIESETEALLPKDLEPMQEDQMDSNSGKLHVSLLTKTETWMMHLATALPKDIIRILCAAGPELSRIKNLENGPKRLLNQKGTRCKRNKIQLTPSVDDDEDEMMMKGPSVESNQGTDSKDEKDTIQDEGQVSDMEDTDNATFHGICLHYVVKPIPESERPATLNQNGPFPDDFSETKNNWENIYATTFLRIVWEDLRLGIESYQTKINLERPNWDAADYYFKEDYTIVPKPRAVVYRDRNDQRKLMRLNELHKFSDGTLTRVMESLDPKVKDIIFSSYNWAWRLGMTMGCVSGMPREEQGLHHCIEKRLQTRRIYRSLESFVGERIRDIDYRLINRTT
ncbi:hypothetical protein Tco_0006852 [Tanacetum coccineum]